MAGPAPKRRPAPARGHDGTTRFAIVAARFNERISERLVAGAHEALDEAKVPREQVEVHWVPGSFELPLAASHLVATGRYAAVICIGVVIRGETPHFDYVAREAATGIREVAVATGVPVTFGVITALSEEQAWARAGGAVGNRGREAAEAAVEMAAFVDRLRNGHVDGAAAQG
jgi:6,7-dimethyl-8-ribityllumazine synthase